MGWGRSFLRTYPATRLDSRTSRRREKKVTMAIDISTIHTSAAASFEGQSRHRSARKCARLGGTIKTPSLRRTCIVYSDILMEFALHRFDPSYLAFCAIQSGICAASDPSGRRMNEMRFVLPCSHCARQVIEHSLTLPPEPLMASLSPRSGCRSQPSDSASRLRSSG